MPIRLVLAEENYLLREGMSRLIEAQPELELAEVWEDFDSLVRAIDTHRPDVVLTDIRMPPTGTNEGIRAAEHLRATQPEAGVVVLSQYADPSTLSSSSRRARVAGATCSRSGCRTSTSC